MVDVLFVGVFDRSRASTNTSQIISLKKNGCNVFGYNYRKRAQEIGNKDRDKELIDLVRHRKPDLVIYSKCNVVSREVFIENSKVSKTCLWFMDPLETYETEEMLDKTSLVDYFCCDKNNVLERARGVNSSSYLVCEGYDEDVDYPVQVQKKWDVSFIGNIYGKRRELIEKIRQPVKIINNVYGHDHARAVSETKINLNFCTSAGASDRVYKIMAASGFLISDDWEGREKNFKHNQDLVIFKSAEDLNEKIEYFLKKDKEREKISLSGHERVKRFSRSSWAKEIIRLYESIKQ